MPIDPDVKPSNVLVTSAGQIKICDFGVSGELINSIADTFVGTSTYMSVSERAKPFPQLSSARLMAPYPILTRQPERIQGAQYTVKSDVWSLGITLVELGMGRFPFSNDEDNSDDDYSADELTLSPVKPGGKDRSLAEVEARRKKRATERAERKKEGVSLGGSGSQMSILELLQHVVNEPAPRLKPENKFSKDTHIFVDSCLMKDVNRRPTPKELLVGGATLSLVLLMATANSLSLHRLTSQRYKWLVDSAEADVDLESWAKSIP